MKVINKRGISLITLVITIIIMIILAGAIILTLANSSIFDKANVRWQIGELGKVDEGGGGTIAQMVANLGADVIDCGVPLWSMHSPFEISSKYDVYMAYKAYKTFFDAE